MKLLSLSLGACLLLTITQTLAKTNTTNREEVFDIWNSGPASNHKAASQDFTLDEREGSGNEVVIDHTHGDEEDFVISGDGHNKDISINEPDISTSAAVTETTTDKYVKKVISDDEDLVTGSGSGEEHVKEDEIETIDVNSSLTEIFLKEDATTTPKLLTPCENLRFHSLNLSNFVPECDADGAFKKRQCRTDKETYCWCVDPLGIEIPGTKFKKPEKPDCDFGENLSTCVFQLVQNSQGLIGSYRPNCTQDGSFEEIQCHDSHCWCVDEFGNEIYRTLKNRTESLKCPSAKTSTAAATKSMQVPTTKSPTSKAIATKTSPHVTSTAIRSHHRNDVILTDSGNEEDDIDVKIDDETQNEDSDNEINEQNFHTNHEPTLHEPILAQPGTLAAIIAGAVVGLLCIVLLIMFIVYRMRKKDEGSYPLDEQKYQNYTYTKAPEKEFYA